MNPHILDELADLVEGRCTPERRLELQQHLDTCTECSGALAFLTEFQSAALAQGRMHLRAARIVALSSDADSMLEVERRHLELCAACRSELAWATSEPGTSALESRVTRIRPVPRRWAFGALTAAATIVVALLLLRGGEESVDVTTLARIEPLRVSISRQVAEPGSFEALRLRALEQYRDADYEAARSSLQQALGLAREDAEILLYSGSTELLLGDAPRALEFLHAAAQGSAEPALREQILWQLAQAQLSLGDGAAAVQTLEQVIALQRGHAAQARLLLEGLRR